MLSVDSDFLPGVQVMVQGQGQGFVSVVFRS